MDTTQRLEILCQPDDSTCGPTCLHAVYRYFGEDVPLDQIAHETPRLPHGGTLAPVLGRHALRKGYAARLYTYNLQVFDPTWFTLDRAELLQRLEARIRIKREAKLRTASRAYLKFLQEGGEVLFEDLTPGLLREYLEERSEPILTGLSSTYLYRCPREYYGTNDYDDIRGEPQGHFVVLCGYDDDTDEVLVADPLHPNPFAEEHHYLVPMDRLICAILLGTLTYDANLLILERAPETERL